MASEYSNHRDQLAQALHPKSRISELSAAIHGAFKGHIEQRQIGYVLFDDVTVEQLAQAFINYPVLVKSILALANVATRAIARDLNTTINTYAIKMSPEKAGAIAGYIKPMLPKEIAIPSIIEIDRYLWTDKQMRARKGQWEQEIVKALVLKSGLEFRKRKFTYNNEQFELDAAHPVSGDEITIGVDVKRIEARRDIHKRCDEVVNKASKFKKRYPEGAFFAVIYYPFPGQHFNVQNRINSRHIDAVFFAGATEDSVHDAMSHLAGRLRDIRNDLKK